MDYVVLLFYVHGNVGHVGTVSLPNHTFPGQLRPPKRLTSTSCTYFHQ